MQVLYFSKARAGNDLVLALREEKFHVSVVRSPPEWADSAPFPYDLVVADLVSLGGASGVEIVRETRMLSRQVPIIVFGSATSLETKLLYFELGIDDFLVTPIVPAEFLARVRALLRRLSESRHESLIVGELRLDRLSHRVFWREHEVHLTKKEFLLLEYLMVHAEKVVNREEIYDEIWHTAVDQSGNTVDVYIRQLRRKIDDRYQQKLIHTVRGHGYMIRENEPVPVPVAVGKA